MCGAMIPMESAMRVEATQRLRELHWLVQAERYLRRARSELEHNPKDDELKALVDLMEEVVGAEHSRVRAA
jgi:hypothetical protein